MKYPTIFHWIGTEFEKARIPFVLVGGFAVNHYRVTRVTADIDLLTTEDNYRKALPLLEQAGYKPVIKEYLFARLRSEQRQDAFPIDILFVDSATLEGVMSEAKEIEIEGIKLKIPSLNHLIALKLNAFKNNPSRRENVDFYDIVNLIEINRIDIRSESFRELCLKFGTPEIYGRILASFQT